MEAQVVRLRPALATGDQLVPSEYGLACGDCGGPMVLLRSTRFVSGRHYQLYYLCKDFPACGGHHGAHQDGRPHGFPADARTRRMRRWVHQVLWLLSNRAGMDRQTSYLLLAAVSGLHGRDAHVGAFDADRCLRVGRLLSGMGPLYAWVKVEDELEWIRHDATTRGPGDGCEPAG